MKVLGQSGLARLIQKMKATFLDKTDIETATMVDIDNVPTANSNNLVKSGGVKSALDTKTSINDNSTTSTTATWSCNKLNSTLGNIESALDEIRGA